MFLGLANASVTFQGMINNIFRDILDDEVLVYIDDILIYFETEKQYSRLVKKVL